MAKQTGSGSEGRCGGVKQAVACLDAYIRSPCRGLPKDIFLFISRMTPIVNVDLLIRNRRQETLLTWRADNYWPPGWHVPGGIVRFKEKIADRIRAVAVGELHASVKWKDPPLAVHELIQPVRKERGHFISFLYVCTLTRALDEDFRYKKGPPQPGQWAWHATCPRNIIPVHEIYRKLIESSARL